MTSVKDTEATSTQRHRDADEARPAFLDLYILLFEKHNQEGDGIWARFNIMAGINVILLGIASYVYSAKSRPEMWREICAILNAAGFLTSVWALFVLRQLWLWHEHWRDLCRKIEQSFPNQPGWPKPHTELPTTLARDVRFSHRWLLPYTQPFILVFALGHLFGFVF